MKRLKRNYGRAVWVTLFLAGCGGIWAGACMPVDGGSPNDNSNGNSNENSSNSNDNSTASISITSSGCGMVDESSSDIETKLTAMTEAGQELSYTRRVITAPEEGGGFQLETLVMAGDELIMSVLTTSDGDGGVNAQIEYGPMVSGLSGANIVAQNGMISGKINDRDIVEMPVDGADALATVFMDGNPAPESGLDPDLEEAVNELLEAARQTSESCLAESSGAKSRYALELGAKIPPQDDGKDSDPEATGGCIACWGGCSANAVGCIAGVSAGCAAATVFYAVCEVAAVAGCAIMYAVCVGACNADGAPCCPVACGEVACCLSGETCLDAEAGICCAAGKTPCLGMNCCSSAQVCVDTGPNAGVCCQPKDVCGNTCCDTDAGEQCIDQESLCCTAEEETCDDKCCPEGETCLGDGLCCDPGNACGTSCCDELDSCITSLNLCCGFNEPACDNKCCDIGQQCLNGNTCCDPGRVCGANDSVCCPVGFSCDPNTLQCVGCPNPTDNPCAVGGCCPVGLNCTDVQGECCPQGETFCNGACRPFGECIS